MLKCTQVVYRQNTKQIITKSRPALIKVVTMATYCIVVHRLFLLLYAFAVHIHSIHCPVDC